MRLSRLFNDSRERRITKVQIIFTDLPHRAQNIPTPIHLIADQLYVFFLLRHLGQIIKQLNS